jgi:divalent metal cation (Fe/Co/Zn/Cd) transporter
LEGESEVYSGNEQSHEGFGYYKKMEISISQSLNQRKPFYKWASALALVTIFYNLIEGCVSVFFGLQDGTVALFGFGLDSYVEVVSGIGIWHMIKRMKRNDITNHDIFEKRALQITGGAFYVLVVGLVVTSAINIYKEYRPETTFWGIVVSVVSILCMWILIHYKVKIGRQYSSQALLADANCSKACMYLSVVLLISSVGYEVTGIGMLDSIGAIGIAVLSYREGREAFEKSKGNLTCSCQGNCH